MVAYLGLFISVVLYATLGPMAKKIGLSMSPFSVVAWTSLVMAILAAFFSFVFERTGPDLTIKQPTLLLGIILYSLVNCVASLIYYAAIRHVPIVHYDVMALITPIVGGLLAVWLLGEPFHARYLVGLAIVSIGIFVAIKPF